MLPVAHLMFFIIIGTSCLMWGFLGGGKEIYSNDESTHGVERGLSGTRTGGCRGLGDG